MHSRNRKPETDDREFQAQPSILFSVDACRHARGGANRPLNSPPQLQLTKVRAQALVAETFRSAQIRSRGRGGKGGGGFRGLRVHLIQPAVLCKCGSLQVLRHQVQNDGLQQGKGKYRHNQPSADAIMWMQSNTSFWLRDWPSGR